jgi:hypothetical protein
MKALLIAGGIGLAAMIGTNTEMGLTNFTQSELNDNEPDSVSTWEVQRMVKKELLARLTGKGGLTTEWGHMDKMGHKHLIFTNAVTEINHGGGEISVASDNWELISEIRNNQPTKAWTTLSENNEVFGEIARYDGSQRTHVCSFKIIYPERKIMARKSALDEWEDIVSFTGKKKADELEDIPLREKRAINEVKKEKVKQEKE